jgi:hypothetical protein
VFQTRSRHRAYRNLSIAVTLNRMLRSCSKQGHAARRIETVASVSDSDTLSCQTKSYCQAFRNTAVREILADVLSLATVIVRTLAVQDSLIIAALPLPRAVSAMASPAISEQAGESSVLRAEGVHRCPCLSSFRDQDARSTMADVVDDGRDVMRTGLAVSLTGETGLDPTPVFGALFGGVNSAAGCRSVRTLLRDGPDMGTT